jgi:Domain of unknown function (DUF4224)
MGGNDFAFPSLFLTEDEMRTLTGRGRKSAQLAQLRLMGIPFHVNAAGKPVVTRTAVEGQSMQPSMSGNWRSSVIPHRP